MIQVINPYSIVLLLSLVVAVGTTVAAWQMRPAAGSPPLTALMASVACWLCAHIFEIAPIARRRARVAVRVTIASTPASG
ncbi:histidine kinase N-terminal 7TM domain-containing protein [Natrinema gelatinilyticum]|uniref:histidine kinase N-terminal 7TM domain-containing protein n=1 Tax=Natrinema gelatinilyticum TaxID=2961571 RepID=UPI0020C344CC|nr:histidine kinase N-terminal 7TM domain-containing protein [Natrinema gelatinilyticum]